jgi:hypothetical protein
MVKEVSSMDDCVTSRMRFEAPAKLALEAAFDGGRLTSDGGLCWLAEVDKELGVCQVMAEHIPEWRTRRGRHSICSPYSNSVSTR